MVNFDIKAIINNSVENADHPFCDEQDFRIAVVEEIKKEYAQYKPLIIAEYKYQTTLSCKKKTNRIDLYVVFDGAEYAIELKYRPNCGLKNKNNSNCEMSLANKGISINWEIKKLNEDKDIHVAKSNNDPGTIITWNNGKTSHKYYILSQNGANECVIDINKMQEYVSKINNKCIAYAVTLSNHDWFDDNQKINYEKAQNNKEKNRETINKVNFVQTKQLDLINIDKGPHKGYWANIYEISK